jgi:hypothetical protein
VSLISMGKTPVRVSLPVVRIFVFFIYRGFSQM